MGHERISEDNLQHHVHYDGKRRTKAAEPDLESVISFASDESIVPPHVPELTAFEVLALLVKRIIGIAARDTPLVGIVLTRNESWTTRLWPLNFVYAPLSMLIRHGNPAALTYADGELFYLAEITSADLEMVNRARRSLFANETRTHESRLSSRTTWVWKGFFGDELLFHIAYSTLFVIFSSSRTSTSRVEGKASVVTRLGSQVAQTDMLKFLITAMALTVLHLVQYRPTKARRNFKKPAVGIRTACVLFLTAAGAVRRHHLSFEGHVWQNSASDIRLGIGSAVAVLFIIFSFEDSQCPSRKGFLRTVIVIGLYLFTVASFLYVIPYASVAVQFAPMVFGNNIAACRAWVMLDAFCALESLKLASLTFFCIGQYISNSGTVLELETWSLETCLSLNSIVWTTLTVILAAVRGELDPISLASLLQTNSHYIVSKLVATGVIRLPIPARYLKGKTRDQNLYHNVVASSRWSVAAQQISDFGQNIFWRHSGLQSGWSTTVCEFDDYRGSARAIELRELRSEFYRQLRFITAEVERREQADRSDRIQ